MPSEPCSYWDVQDRFCTLIGCCDHGEGCWYEQCPTFWEEQTTKERARADALAAELEAVKKRSGMPRGVLCDLHCGECPCWEPCGDTRYPNEGECEIMAIQTTRVRKCFPRAADIAKAVDKWRVWRAEREAEARGGKA